MTKNRMELTKDDIYKLEAHYSPDGEEFLLVRLDRLREIVKELKEKLVCDFCYQYSADQDRVQYIVDELFGEVICD